MTLKDLRKKMMLAKKNEPNKAKVYQAVLCTAQLIAKEDGNREVTESDITNAYKKEVKMAEQSKEAGAPFLEEVFDCADEFLPKQLSENELSEIIQTEVQNQGEKSMKLMGIIMKILNEKYPDQFDRKLASDLIKKEIQK